MFSPTAEGSRYKRDHYKVLCPFKSDNKYSKALETCYLSWTSKGVLFTNKNKNQIRINEIINTLKTMDSHFGKKKFRSGNIPFTMFGTFDQKQNVLFKDSTDEFKTKFEFLKVSSFQRNIENYLDNLASSNQQCSHSSSIHKSIVLLTSAVLLICKLL
jgi:Transferrin